MSTPYLTPRGIMRNLARPMDASKVPDAGGAQMPAADGWDIGVDGANSLLTLTDANPGGGGANNTGLDPILDVIDNASRRLTGLDFSPDGMNCVACSQSGIIASFSLSTAWDLSTATQTGSSVTGVTLANNVRFNEDGTRITYLGASDLFRIRPLATPYQVASSDSESVNTISKAEMGCSGSNDPIACMALDGSGIWVYGTNTGATSAAKLIWVPLGTDYDFSTPGTPVLATAVQGNIHSSPFSSSIYADIAGEDVMLLAGVDPERIFRWDLSVAFDPDSQVSTNSNDINVTQNYDMMAVARDFSRIIVWDAVFVTQLDIFGAA